MKILRISSGLRSLLYGRVLFWLVLGGVASIALGGLEMGVALSLLMVLEMMGFQASPSSMPAFLDGWNPDIATLFALIILIMTLRAAFTFIVGISPTFSAVLVQAKVKLAVFYDLLQRDNHVYISAAEINFRNEEVSRKAASFIMLSSKLANSFLQAGALLIMLAWISWELTIVSVGLFGICGPLIKAIHKRINPISHQMPIRARAIAQGIERVARNWMLIRILRIQDNEYDRQVDRILGYAAMDLKMRVLGLLNSLAPILIGSYLLVMIVFMNAEWIGIEAGAVVSFLYVFLRFLQAASGGVVVLGGLAADRPFFDIAATVISELGDRDRIQALAPSDGLGVLGRSSTYAHVPRFTDNSLIPQPAPPEVRVENVEYRYAGQDAAVLSGLSIDIPKGCQFAIVGPSGSGKSTLLGVILGILDPTSGDVSIDGMPPSEFFKTRAVRLGYVGADPLLIDGTIADNLRYGAADGTDLSDEACLAAMRRAHMDDLIKSNANILSYRLNENSEGLSAGQKQRLSLARALLSRPQLLILDEVSANLDEDTEAEIASMVSELKGSCTTIIVSHRPGMLAHADTVLPMAKIWDTGSEQSATNLAE